MYLALIFPIIFLAATAAPPTSPGKHNTLVLLHVLFRHGNRAPDKASSFPNDLHINHTYNPHGYSQLTKKGKETEYEIGRYIRETYDKFIPDQYTSDVVYALSTNTKRTKMSLELVLAGLFPPLLSDIFTVGLNWQPIPFNVEPGAGLIGVPLAYCPVYTLSYYKYLRSKEARNIIADYKDLYSDLSKFSGSDVQSPKDAANIYFTLKSQEDFDLPLPEWASGIYPEVLEEAAAVDYEFSTANPTLKKYSAGFLLKKILDDTESKINGSLSDERKIFLYSAHEFNVGCMLRTLNVFQRHVPPFGATIFFEIHYIRGQHVVKLFYQDYTEDEPKLLTIPGCDSFCPLDKLYELIGESLPRETDVCSPINELM